MICIDEADETAPTITVINELINAYRLRDGLNEVRVNEQRLQLWIILIPSTAISGKHVWCALMRHVQILVRFKSDTAIIVWKDRNLVGNPATAQATFDQLDMTVVRRRRRMPSGQEANGTTSQQAVPTGGSKTAI